MSRNYGTERVKKKFVFLPTKEQPKSKMSINEINEYYATHGYLKCIANECITIGYYPLNNRL